LPDIRTSQPARPAAAGRAAEGPPSQPPAVASQATRDPRLERRAALADPMERYRRMVEIRRTEDQVKELFAEGLVAGSTHTCQGQEAVSVGLALATRPTDTVLCTYRGHGHALALGLTPEAVVAEILGRQTGCVGGVGGSMHLSSRTVGLMPTMAIVGAGIPIAAGVGWAAQVAGDDTVAVSLFGDGAANIGAFHESLNLAAIWRLPVVYVCENNLYGEYSRISATTPVSDLAVRASSYSILGEVVDGQDLDTVTAALSGAIERARSGGGPTLLEMKTYRYSGHSRSDPATYRPPGELDAWLGRDPLEIYGARLIETGAATPASLEAVRAEVEASVARAVEAARAAPEPHVDAMFRHVHAESGRLRGIV
jgi:acetoin:2,6-dichlorophenolindophenol oxidoreductase subunit alpha